jgi:hypothetical protein
LAISQYNPEITLSEPHSDWTLQARRRDAAPHWNFTISTMAEIDSVSPLLKMLLPRCETEAGMTTDQRFKQLEKVTDLTEVTELPMMTDGMLVQQ